MNMLEYFDIGRAGQIFHLVRRLENHVHNTLVHLFQNKKKPIGTVLLVIKGAFYFGTERVFMSGCCREDTICIV